LLSNSESIVGTSYCSMSDNFVYRTGRELAYERAMELYYAKYGK
jgi:hypothetical protein